jgi:outer membrane protein TolC
MLSCLRGFVAAVGVGLVAAGPMHAQPLTLADTQRLALARSQSLAANAAAADAAREMAVAAGRLPDPVLKLGVENLPLGGAERFSLSRDSMTMRRVGVMQELTSGDKRRSRSARAEAEGERVRAERLLALSEIQRESASAWVEAAYRQSMLELLREQLREARLQVDAAELLFRTGRGGQADVFGARAAVAGVQDSLRLAQRQQLNARVMLARWVGAGAADRPLAGSIDWRDPAVERMAQADHLRDHPELVLRQSGLRAAEADLRQAQANTRPDWTVELMYSQRGSAFSDMVSVGVSVPLQLDRGNRQDREVAARVAMLDQARARYEEAARAEEAMVRQRVNEWASGRDRLDKLGTELLEPARNRTQAALAGYRAGKGDLSSVLSARREEIDARMQVLSLEMDVARLWVQLRYLVPEPALGMK